MANKNVKKIFTKMATRAGQSPNSKRNMFKAWKWFQQNAKSIKRVDRKALMEDGNYKKTAKPKVGGLYMFYYDPKMKSVLPYYDRFPLIIMIGPAPRGFYGINFHYISPKLRAILMDELIKIATLKKVGKMRRLQLTYELLKTTSKLAAFKPCLKRYLNKHLVTPPREVPQDDWEKVLFLPTESFVGSSTSAVWKASLKKI